MSLNSKIPIDIYMHRQLSSRTGLFQPSYRRKIRGFFVIWPNPRRTLTCNKIYERSFYLYWKIWAITAQMVAGFYLYWTIWVFTAQTVAVQSYVLTFEQIKRPSVQAGPPNTICKRQKLFRVTSSTKQNLTRQKLETVIYDIYVFKELYYIICPINSFWLRYVSLTGELVLK